MLTPAVSEQLLRTEIGYAGATALLAAALAVLYRGGSRRTEVEGGAGTGLARSSAATG